MTELTNTQRLIIEEGANNKYEDIRELKTLQKYAPAIRSKIIQSMLGHGLLTAKEDGDFTIYSLSEKAYAAIGEPAAEEILPPAEPVTIIEAPATEPKVKGKSKQQIMLDMLTRDEGATVSQLQEAIGWQKHSIFGSMANLKKKLKINISNSKIDGLDRIYKIVA